MQSGRLKSSNTCGKTDKKHFSLIQDKNAYLKYKTKAKIGGQLIKRLIYMGVAKNTPMLAPVLRPGVHISITQSMPLHSTLVPAWECPPATRQSSPVHYPQ